MIQTVLFAFYAIEATKSGAEAFKLDSCFDIGCFGSFRLPLHSTID